MAKTSEECGHTGKGLPSTRNGRRKLKKELVYMKMSMYIGSKEL